MPRGGRKTSPRTRLALSDLWIYSTNLKINLDSILLFGPRLSVEIGGPDLNHRNRCISFCHKARGNYF